MRMLQRCNWKQYHYGYTRAFFSLGYPAAHAWRACACCARCSWPVYTEGSARWYIMKHKLPVSLHFISPPP